MDNHFQDLLGEGKLPLLRGLQLAHELQADLHGLPLSNSDEASKSFFIPSLIADLLDIVGYLKDAIDKLSSTPLQPPQENMPLNQQSHARHDCRKSRNSPCVARGCQLHGQKKLVQKTCPTRFKFTLHAVKEGFNDGFTWRKYGHKTILGNRHPRSYYRCIHKRDLNCPAKKQVQECGNIASTFDVTYIENHTCEGGCEEPYKAIESYAAPFSSLMVSANSHTGMPAIMHAEPSLNACEIEIEKEVRQDPAIIKDAATTTIRSLLGLLLEHDHPMQPMSATYSPLEVSCATSSEKPSDNSPNLGADVKGDQEQQEESSTLHNDDLRLPLYRDFEPFPGFVEYFEGQLQY